MQSMAAMVHGVRAEKWQQVRLLVLPANVPGAHEAQTAEDEAPAAASATLQIMKWHLQSLISAGHTIM
jgi:hypothetical protein